MQRTNLSATFFGLLLFCWGGVLLASEADELRERAKATRKETSAVAERGNNEQAERLEKESVKLLEAADRIELKAKGSGEPGIEREVRRLNVNDGRIVQRVIYCAGAANHAKDAATEWFTLGRPE